jgi:hypothetical protein
MSHPLIRKAVKLLAVLLIISFFCNSSFAQTPKTLDSVSLKKELDAVLAKYGLKTKGFAVNVISVNQKGGQTAYTITNNYYGDTTKIEANYGFDSVIHDGIKYIYVYPKKGVWQSPFIGLDSARTEDYIYDVGVGLGVIMHGLSFTPSEDSSYRNMLLFFRQGNCSKTLPMKVGLRNKNGFFLFGDFAESNKVYFYFKGQIFYAPFDSDKAILR